MTQITKEVKFILRSENNSTYGLWRYVRYKQTVCLVV
jgi:hypothetical protein